MIDFLVGILVGVVIMWLFGGKMASAQDLTTSLANLTAAVNALTTAFINKASGIDPASLDPIQSGMDALTTGINNALYPPTP